MRGLMRRKRIGVAQNVASWPTMVVLTARRGAGVGRVSADALRGAGGCASRNEKPRTAMMM
jgi:hypothetical protein